MSLLCRFNHHAFRETDEFGRTFCERCSKREPKRFAQIQDAALAGRVLKRPRTRGEKL